VTVLQILIISPLYPSDERPDRGTFVAAQAKILLDMGHSVRVISPTWWLPRPFNFIRADLKNLNLVKMRENRDGVEVYRRRMLGLPNHPLPRLTEWSVSRHGKGLESELADWEPDLIINHTLWPSLAVTVPLAEKYDTSVVCWVHGWDEHSAPIRVHKRISSLLSRLSLMRRPVNLVIVSESQRQWATGISPRGTLISHIPTPTIIGESVESDDIEQSFPSEKHLRLLFPGSPSRKVKDYRLFESVVAELRARGLIIETSVLDQISPSSVKISILKSDIVLLTSRREASPLVPREAICLGRRVTAVPVGDLSEYIPPEALASSRRIADIADSVIAAQSLPISAWSHPDIYSESFHRNRLNQLLCLD
jgi:hypothetical protein